MVTVHTTNICSADIFVRDDIKNMFLTCPIFRSNIVDLFACFVGTAISTRWQIILPKHFFYFFVSYFSFQNIEDGATKNVRFHIDKNKIYILSILYFIFSFTYIYIYIYIYTCVWARVYACVCVLRDGVCVKLIQRVMIIHVRVSWNF